MLDVQAAGAPEAGVSADGGGTGVQFCRGSSTHPTLKVRCQGGYMPSFGGQGLHTDPGSPNLGLGIIGLNVCMGTFFL